jgi:uncharacterized membrane protein YeaQ/YmgE (transglycosylase-associated protein family)
MYLLWEIIIGILAGFLAGQIVKGSGMGILIDLLVGVVGSIIGGWIFGLLGLASYGLIGQLVMATVGAIVLLLIVKAIKRAEEKTDPKGGSASREVVAESAPEVAA